MYRPFYFWTIFIILLAVTAYVGLFACSITLPGFGRLIERCPSAVSVVSAPDIVEANRLKKEYQALLVASAQAPECRDLKTPETPIELPPDIEPPPKIHKSEKLVFILDTSLSMKSDVLSNGMHAADLAIPLLEDTFSVLKNRIPMSLWTYGSDCSSDPVPIGDAHTLQARDLQSLHFDAGSSAVALTILRIPLMIPVGAGLTPDRPMNVVLISDGDDTCGAPPEIRGEKDSGKAKAICVAARKLARERPYLAIHVVALDASVRTAMQCVKEATNGWIIETKEPQSLRKAVEIISRGGA